MNILTLLMMPLSKRYISLMLCIESLNAPSHHIFPTRFHSCSHGTSVQWCYFTCLCINTYTYIWRDWYERLFRSCKFFKVKILNVFFVPCKSCRVLKVSEEGRSGLSFIGTLRATQIKQDCKSLMEQTYF